MIPVFFTCECYIGLFFQGDDSGDKSVSTGWELTTTDANTEKGEEENGGEEIGGVCYVNLAGLREEDGLYGGVEDSELLGGRY